MDDVEEALRQFRGEFVRASRERVGEMESLLDRLRWAAADGQVLQVLVSHFHGLVGAGGTYGFARISELAAQGELDCKRVQEAQAAAAPAEIDRWKGLVAEIRASLDGWTPEAG